MRTIIVIILIILFCSGCAHDKITFSKGDVTTTVDIFYFMQEKGFKKLSWNPETGQIEVENFGSDTSETLNTVRDLLIGYGVAATP